MILRLNLFLLVIAIILYSGCKKDDVSGTRSKLPVVVDSTSVLKVTPRWSFAERVSGRYVVSGNYSCIALSYNGPTTIYNDTILITACGDSSIAVTLSSVYFDGNRCSLCCAFTPNNWNSDSNYAFNGGNIYLAAEDVTLSFPIKQFGSKSEPITISAGWVEDCGYYDGELNLSGIRIH